VFNPYKAVKIFIEEYITRCRLPVAIEWLLVSEYRKSEEVWSTGLHPVPWTYFRKKSYFVLNSVNQASEISCRLRCHPQLVFGYSDNPKIKFEKTSQDMLPKKQLAIMESSALA